MAKNVSLGSRAGVSYVDNKGYGADSSLVDTRFTSLRVGPRVGVNLPLGRSLSLWPTAAVGFEWVRQTESVVSGTSSSVAASPLGYPVSTELGPWVEVDVALLWHMTPHLFVGGGSRRLFMASATCREGPRSAGRRPRCSPASCWVVGLVARRLRSTPGSRRPRQPPSGALAGPARPSFSNELVLDGRWTGYAGSPSSSSGGGLTAGVDYFAADHVSIGAAFSASAGTTTGIDATTNTTVTSQSSGQALSFRFGVDIPMGELLSFWPRASLGFGWNTLNEQEVRCTLSNDEHAKIVSVGLYAPVLVHPATHFFVGFGPSVAHDLAHSISFGSTSANPVENESTTLGAGLVVGGWL